MNTGFKTRSRKVLPQPVAVMSSIDIGNYLTTVTRDEEQLARQYWAKYASKKLLASTDSPYMVKRLQYYQIVGNGEKGYFRRIPYTSVKTDVIRFANGVRNEHRELTQSLILNQISGQDWYQRVMFLAKLTHLSAFIVEEGMFDFEDMDRVDRWLVTVAPVFISITNLASQLSAGQRELSGRLLLASDSFADHVVESFENLRLNWALGNGIRKARRIPMGTEACHDTHERKGCVELAAKGYQPIWAMTPIGGAACYHKCRCIIDYEED